MNSNPYGIDCPSCASKLSPAAASCHSCGTRSGMRRVIGGSWMVVNLAVASLAVTVAAWPWLGGSLPSWTPSPPALDTWLGLGTKLVCVQPVRSNSGERLEVLVARSDCRKVYKLDETVTAALTDLRKQQPKARWLRAGLPFTKDDPDRTPSPVARMVRNIGNNAISISSLLLGLITLGALGRLRLRLFGRDSDPASVS